MTEVVPAPDEPVMAMMGCFADIGASSWGCGFVRPW
jgi:hypothetical protein